MIVSHKSDAPVGHGQQPNGTGVMGGMIRETLWLRRVGLRLSRWRVDHRVTTTARVVP